MLQCTKTNTIGAERTPVLSRAAAPARPSCRAAAALVPPVRPGLGCAPCGVRLPPPGRSRPIVHSAASGWWPFGSGSATMQPPSTTRQQQQQGSTSVVRDVTAEQLRARVEQHNTNPAASTPLILMFTAAWCGPCSLVHKELTKLGALRPAGTFEVMALDVDAGEANSQLASELGIYTLPTLIFVGKAGELKPAISTTGNTSMSLIADVLDNKMSVCGASLKNRLRM